MRMLLILLMMVATVAAKPPSNYHHRHSERIHLANHDEKLKAVEQPSIDKHDEIHNVVEQSNLDKHEEIHKAVEQPSIDKHEEKHKAVEQPSIDKHEEKLNVVEQSNLDKHEEKLKAIEQSTLGKDEQKLKAIEQSNLDKHEEIHKAVEQSTLGKDEQKLKAIEQSNLDKHEEIHKVTEQSNLDKHEDKLKVTEQSILDKQHDEKDKAEKRVNNEDRLYNDTEQQEEVNFNVTMPIAFSAELAGDVYMGINQTIVMNKVLVNKGHVYFNDTGIFVCPNDDVYVFFWTVKRSGTATSERATGRLMMGNTILKDGPICNYYTTSSEYGSGSCMMTLTAQCAHTRSVRVLSGNYSSSITGTTYQSKFTSFSGFRLGPADDTVAASVETSRDIYLTDRYRVFFDKLTTNIGMPYTKRCSYFRCPVSGTYVFTLTVQSVEKTTQWSIVQLMMDDKPVINGSMTYSASSSRPSGSSSATVAVHCNQGSDVWVDSVVPDNFAYGSFGRAMTSLTAYLLPEDNAIAFSAGLSRRYSGTSGIVPFDDILTNVGGHYNTNGSFLCPDDDLYAFIVTLLSESGSVTAVLQMDTKPLAHGPVLTAVSGSSGSSGNHATAVVVQCRKWSTVNVKITSDYSTSYFTAGYNYFTGFKIPGQ